MSYSPLPIARMDVIVLSTSVQSPVQVKKLAPVLNTLAGKGNWNFALDDCDRVLRIISDNVSSADAIRLLEKSGFECRELEW
jgi:hypothetical protein